MYECVIPSFKVSGISTENMELCGQFINSIDCKCCHAKHFAGFKKCKSRWCSNCNHLRSLLWMAKLYPVLFKWVDDGNNVFKVGFTVKDTDSVREGLDLIETSWRGMTHDDKNFRKYWKGRFVGGIRSLEVKIGRHSKQWHPHLHCLLLTDGTFHRDYNYLKDNWEYHTNKFYSLVLRDKTEKIGSVYLKGLDSQDLMKELAEAIKYLTKFDDCVEYIAKSKVVNGGEYPNRLVELVFELKGKRAINTWGILRGLNKEVEKVLMLLI